MEHHNLTVDYALVQGFYWMGFASVLGFASVYLLDSGFGNSQIGVIIAAAGVISALLQPVIAGYADRSEKISLKQIILAVGFAIFLGAVCLIFFRNSVWMTGVFFGFCIALLQIATPLVNSLGVVNTNENTRLNYGVARGIGSAAYAAIAYVTGILVDDFGCITVSAVMAAVFLLFTVAVWRYPFLKPGVLKKEENKYARVAAEETGSGTFVRKKADSFGFFKKYPRFCLVLSGCILLYISHVLLNSFTFQIVQSKGGGSGEMGVAIALSAVMELPVMFLFSIMLKHVRCDIWFRISAVFFMLKTLGTLLCQSVGAFYAVQLLQMMGWGLITVSSVFYVRSIMRPEDTVKGQAYFTMTYTVGSVIGAAAGGSLIDHFGVDAMLLFATVCSLGGMAIVCFGTERKTK